MWSKVLISFSFIQILIMGVFFHLYSNEYCVNKPLKDETVTDVAGLESVTFTPARSGVESNVAMVNSIELSETRNHLDVLDVDTADKSIGIKLLPPIEGIYHAAFAEFGPREDLVTTKKISNFRLLTNKDIIWGYFSNNWFDGIVYPRQQINTLHSNGIMPFVRLMPRSRFQVGGQDPVYTLQKIIDGEFDNDLRNWASEAAASGIPLLLEFGTEVNGDWFTWSGASNGAGVTDQFGDPNIPDGPERFQVAYRHIIDLFRDEGANNITWFFHVNLISYPVESWNEPRMYYPGDDYIDWIGISVYGAQHEQDPWLSFSDMMDIYYDSIQSISLDKPIAVLEFGVVERPDQNKAKWIEDALESIVAGRYENIRAISYWHSSWVNADGFVSNMRLNSSIEPLMTYREIIQNHIFITSPLLSD